jgi:hypothetical protein
MSSKIGPAAIREIKSWGVAPVAPIERRKDRVDAVFAPAPLPAPQLAVGALLAPTLMAALIYAQERIAA